VTAPSATPSVQRRPRVRVALAVAAVAVCAAVVALNGLQIRALSFGKGVDQTYLFESLESTVHGRFFHHTHAITNRGGWGEMDHFWPTMLLFVPLVALIGHQIVLYLINGLCLAATGMVVFALARDFLEDERLAAIGRRRRLVGEGAVACRRGGAAQHAHLVAPDRRQQLVVVHDQPVQGGAELARRNASIGTAGLSW
jgi:hypothetical protein